MYSCTCCYVSKKLSRKNDSDVRFVEVQFIVLEQGEELVIPHDAAPDSTIHALFQPNDQVATQLRQVPDFQSCGICDQAEGLVSANRYLFP